MDDRLPKMLGHWNVPQAHWQATLNRIPDECSHKVFVQNYCANIIDMYNENMGLILWGEYGSGKSALAAIIIKAAFSVAPCSDLAYWINAGNLAKYVIENTLAYFDDTHGEYYHHELAMRNKILIIDELKISQQPSKAETYVEQLIRERIGQKKLTIITTNLNPEEIEKRYPALASPMLEAFYEVNVNGFDFREQRANRIAERMEKLCVRTDNESPSG